MHYTTAELAPKALYEKENGMRIALAYSGGLDTSAAIAWLKKHRRTETIVACLVDVGQGEDLPSLAERAKRLGADEAVIVDKRESFARNGLLTALRAGAVYESGYLLGTAIARPFIAEALSDVAIEFQCSHACHGATAR